MHVESGLLFCVDWVGTILDFGICLTKNSILTLGNEEYFFVERKLN
jgi:hypothetical protein